MIARSLSLVLLLAILLPSGNAADPILVKLLARPLVQDSSFLREWKNPVGAELTAHYATPGETVNGQQRLGSQLHFQATRNFTYGASQRKIGMQLESRIMSPQVGETLVIAYAPVKIVKLTSGQQATATMELVQDSNLAKIQGQVGNGVAICINGFLEDRDRTLELQDIVTREDAKDEFEATVKYHRGFAMGESVSPLRVGDVIPMKHFKLRIGSLTRTDKEASQRGWMSVEPVLENPVVPGP